MKQSEISNKKRSDSMKKLISSGNFFSEKHKQNISDSLKGRKITWYTGRKGKKSHRKGMTLEQEYGLKKAIKIRNKISKNTKIKMNIPEIKYKVIEGAKKGLRTLALKNQTYIEQKMQEILNKLKLNYEIQKIIPFKTVNNGNWRRVDFYLPESNLIIECDGKNWHTKEGNNIKNKELNKNGFDILRFWGSQILKYPKEISNYIEIYNERMVRING